jgi:hypothetical protein
MHIINGDENKMNNNKKKHTLETALLSSVIALQTGCAVNMTAHKQAEEYLLITKQAASQKNAHSHKKKTWYSIPESFTVYQTERQISQDSQESQAIDQQKVIQIFFSKTNQYTQKNQADRENEKPDYDSRNPTLEDIKCMFSLDKKTLIGCSEQDISDDHNVYLK